MGGGQVRATRNPRGGPPPSRRAPPRPARARAPPPAPAPRPGTRRADVRGGGAARRAQGDGGSPWRDAGVKQRVGMWLRDKGARAKDGGESRLDLLGRVGVGGAPSPGAAAPEKRAPSPAPVSRKVRPPSPPRPPAFPSLTRDFIIRPPPVCRSTFSWSEREKGEQGQE